MISETLWLNKPYFAIPVGGQIEQIINALYIKKLGFGDWSEKLTAQKTLDFIKTSEKYRKNLIKAPKEDMDKLYKKLDSIIKALV